MIDPLTRAKRRASRHNKKVKAKNPLFEATGTLPTDWLTSVEAEAVKLDQMAAKMEEWGESRYLSMMEDKRKAEALHAFATGRLSAARMAKIESMRKRYEAKRGTDGWAYICDAYVRALASDVFHCQPCDTAWHICKELNIPYICEKGHQIGRNGFCNDCQQISKVRWWR